MRIGLVQINPTVGDLSGNAERIRAAVRGAPAADLFVTSEMALTFVAVAGGLAVLVGARGRDAA